jgi:hypothetical protein
MEIPKRRNFCRVPKVCHPLSYSPSFFFSSFFSSISPVICATVPLTGGTRRVNNPRQSPKENEISSEWQSGGRRMDDKMARSLPTGVYEGATRLSSPPRRSCKNPPVHLLFHLRRHSRNWFVLSVNGLPWICACAYTVWRRIYPLSFTRNLLPYQVFSGFRLHHSLWSTGVAMRLVLAHMHTRIQKG